MSVAHVCGHGLLTVGQRHFEWADCAAFIDNFSTFHDNNLGCAGICNGGCHV